jgi:hypothetical protein
MIIRGLLDRSLSSTICIRGFAPIKELAKISKANYKYQRKLLNVQEATISNFLELEKYLFFPEVILSYKIKHDYTRRNLALTPLQLIEQGKSFKSNIDNTKIRVKKNNYKSVFDVCQRNEINIIELELDDTLLAEAIASHDPNRLPFDRIDGNHRLSASENLNTDRIVNMNVPFCIILAEETYRMQFNPSTHLNEKVRQENPEKFEMVVFHNINTKTIPLTSEQNLKVIVDDNKNFTNEELQEILGVSGVKTRELITKVNPEIYTGIKHILFDQYRTYYLEIFDRLLEEGINESEMVDKVFESLKEIDVLYANNDDLKANSSFGLLTAFLYYHVSGNKAKFKFFTEWVLSNHIFKVPEATADSFITIFDKIADQNIMVFVAMPYYGADQVETYNRAYERVIDKVKTTYNQVKIDIYPIMQHEGRTKDIIQNMLNEIKNCRIFISDVTKANPNVAYELGYARSINIPTIIVKQEDDPNEVPFDYDHDVYKKYKKDAIHTLEEIVYHDIVAILKKEFGLIVETESAHV